MLKVDTKVAANEVLQRRGYLVVSHDSHLRVGQVLPRVGNGEERIEEKTVVIAETDAHDSLVQGELLQRLGLWEGPFPVPSAPFYYRVIAE